MALYNHAVTGDFMRTPYGLHLDQYFGQGVFLFGPMHQPERTPPEHVAGFYESFDGTPSPRHRELIGRVMQQSAARLPGTVAAAFGLVQPPSFGEREPYRGALLWLALLIPLWANLSNRMFLFTTCVACLTEALLWWRVPLYPFWLWLPVTATWIVTFAITAGGSRWSQFVAGGILLMVFGQSLVVWWWPHYAAPGVPLVLAGAAMALQRLARAPRSTPRRRPLGAVLLVLISAYILTLAALACRHARRATSACRQSVARRCRAPVGIAHRAASGLRALRTGRLDTRRVGLQPRGTGRRCCRLCPRPRPLRETARLIAALPGRSIWTARVSQGEALLAPYPDATPLQPTKR